MGASDALVAEATGHTEAEAPAKLGGTAKAIELHRLINDTDLPYPADRSVVELFEDSARRHADRVAVVHGSRRITYAELGCMANCLAATLRAHGVEPGDAVGVCAKRTPELIATLIAVLKCGAAYLPVSAEWPRERTSDLFGQANVRVLATDQPARHEGRFPGLSIVPVQQAARSSPDAGLAAPALTISPDAIAYINFTSGSTGRPKGVPIRHRSIARLVFNASYARLDQDSVLLQHSPVTFDAATFEVWGALLHGGTCVLYPAEFLRFSRLKRVLDAEGVTVLFLTTALFNSVVDEAPATLDQVGTVLTGGEAHSLKHIGRALERYGPDRIVSVYGPTEATTFATYHPVRSLAADETALPIGVPIQNTRAYVVEESRLCGPGEVGEVWLGGPGLAPGYLGLPQATRERFIECEVDGCAERLYRTGDRAYLRADGVLVFQGRLDDQVKVNGFRIELGEVAHHLDAHPEVRQSYVTVVEDPAAGKALVAFVVPQRADCDVAGIKAYLDGRLPAFMVPNRIRLCESLPLSPTGKVDRNALLAVLSQTPSAS
jgi:amino acid adenylation domain-containing protein